MKSPFPYKIEKTGNLYDGYLFPVPAFCKANENNPKCRAFYTSLPNDGNIYKCPYGFCACKAEIGDSSIVLSCLNIAKYTDKTEVNKRLHSKDWMPRLDKPVFEKALKAICDETNILDATQKEFEQKKSWFSQEVQVLNDTLHEVRKINNQLKSSSEQLSNSLKELNEEKTKEIDNIRKNLLANCDLLSIRLNAYDMVVNPSLHENSIPIDIPIYRNVEKVYKCLHNYRKKRNVHVEMKGTSVSSYKARSIIEVGLFIIIENAIKYSPEGETVSINFIETEKELEVRFQNWGPRVQPGELIRLTERGYRAETVVNIGEIEGSGIGLYLLKKICDSNSIRLNIKCGNDMKVLFGWIYKPFIVTLVFPLK